MNIAQFRRNIFEPLFLLKSKSPRLAYWQHLEKTQYYSLEQLKEVQWSRLKDIWQYLWQNNVFYRQRFLDAGLQIQDLRTIEDIRNLPILTKKEVRDQQGAMISKGYSQEKLLHFKTGGSTGKALDLYLTEECSEFRNACARRHDRWAGWEPGEPIGAVWGNPKLSVTLKEKLQHYLIQPFIYLDTISVSSASVKEFAIKWQKVKPTLLYGHAHSLFLLAQYLRDIGSYEIKPKGILSTSMMLLTHERELIEKVFSCKVKDRYGCEEVSLIGCECEKHTGLHMNIEHLVIEFIKDDGKYAFSGEPGRIIVTDLMNFAMPLVRYEVEDVGVPLDTKCSCGRGLPLMGKVAGRVADFLVCKNGDKVAGISLIENTLTKMAGIDQMQIIQNSINEMVLNIVPGRGFTGLVQSNLLDYFKRVFPGTSVTVKRVKEILPEVSGKYRFSICRIPEES